jgi:chromate reductase
MTLKILAIPGSLRAAAFSRKALQACIDHAPEGMEFETVEIRDIPFYDGDVEATTGLPASVVALREKIKAADAVIVSSPEYNASTSAVLKNAIDWCSRPPSQPFSGKPMAIITSSPGATGGIRAHMHLRQVLGNVNALVLVAPTVTVGMAGQRFDAEGKLTDLATIDFLKSMMTGLRDWTNKLKA